MIARPAIESERLPVAVSATDPVSRAGIMMQLRGIPGIALVDEGQLDAQGIALVIADEVDEETARVLRALKRRGANRLVLIVTRIDEGGLMAAVEAGATGVLRRSEATGHNLLATIRSAAAGDGTLPPDLLGRLLEQVGRLQRQVLSPRGLTLAGLTARELRVLKLLADGLDTAEVGQQLFCSERTVKHALHDVTTRLNLRNRTHAVAYAMKQGLI